MNTNLPKLVVVAVLALACIAAVLVDSDHTSWAVPLLGLLVGYVVGNAAVTDRTGPVAPIVERRLPPPPPAGV